MRCKGFVPACVLLGLLWVGMAGVSAQQPPYSNPPIMQAFQTTNLVLPYTSGTIIASGGVVVIPSGTVTLTDNEQFCAPPQYVACNVVYWKGGTTLSVTTVAAEAFTPGQSVVAVVTTRGGQVLSVLTAGQLSTTSDNFTPVRTPVNNGLRLPLCGNVLTVGCQQPTGSLNGY